jgi:hypothetical protein
MTYLLPNGNPISSSSFIMPFTLSSSEKFNLKTQVNVRYYNLSKCILNKESHVKRYCENLPFASYIILPKFDGIVQVQKYISSSE